MPDPKKISIHDFNYLLPEEKIALYPLQQRDASRLLVYKNDELSQDTFANLADHIPSRSLLVFNNTKVINARLRYKKNTGGIIEIFCLEPYEKFNDYSSVMNQTGSVRWKCFIGGAAKWKEKELNISKNDVRIRAVLIEKLNDTFLVEFSWEPAEYTFTEIIELVGDIPLPPYIKRSAEIEDERRYQTIYAAHDGSVAAPTAGLHFTEKIFQRLDAKKIGKTYITLHVGAGTFKPVKSLLMQDHVMHAEWINVTIETIQKILVNKNEVIAVGTTSTRTIESIYWLGVKIFLDPGCIEVNLKQWEVYSSRLAEVSVSVDESLNALINWIKQRNEVSIFTQTELLILPGYSFKVVKAIITNFHQPQSTLLLLIAAATRGRWKHIYEYALQNDFRFLSFGDGNLIFI